MAKVTELANQLAFIQTLHEVTTAYEEIDMMRIRDYEVKILRHRAYIEGLLDVYHDIATALPQKETRHEIRQVLVLITPNKGLAGPIVQQIFASFAEYRTDHPDNDVIIIGRTGKELYVEREHAQPTHYYELSTESTDEQWRTFIEETAVYDHMIIFHGYFENLFLQKTKTVDAVRLRKEDIPLHTTLAKDACIFEPDIRRLVLALQAQMLEESLQSGAKEGFLAELGSRISSLEMANDRITKEKQALTAAYRAAVKAKKTNRSMSNLAGVLSNP